MRESAHLNGRAGLRPYVLRAGEGVTGFDSSVKDSRLFTGGCFTLIESRTTGGAPLHVHTPRPSSSLSESRWPRNEPERRSLLRSRVS